MELFKEKEEAEIINKNIDPETGINLKIDNFDELDLESLKTNSMRNNIYRKNHMPKKNKKNDTDVEVVEEQFHPNYGVDDEIVLDYLPDEMQETLSSIDEFLNFLDNNEEEV